MDIKETELYKKITSDSFIYYIIYSVDSYIFEKELLSYEDYKILTSLKDKFSILNENKALIKDIKNKIDEVLVNDEYFKAKVYFKPKKLDVEQVVFRPLHTATLIEQIAMACLLAGIINDIDDNGKITLNNLGKILPNNFYGNIPSENPKFLFCPWVERYSAYVDKIEERYIYNDETHKYKYEVTLDLQNFFPSIPHQFIIDKLTNEMKIELDSDELACFEKIVTKLVDIKLDTSWTDDDNEKISYYKQYLISSGFSIEECENIDVDEIRVEGIAQGLPQAYYFGNICMIDVSKVYSKVFEGESYFYVDDSVIYTNNIDNYDDFISKLESINEEFERVFDGYFDLHDCKIKVHTHKKSNYIEINGAKFGKPYLNILSRLASLSSFEMKKIFSDIEGEILSNKLNVLYDNVVKEIKRINDLEKDKKSDEESQHEEGQVLVIQDDENQDEEIYDIKSSDIENYKKILFRYKKFLEYRIYVLTMNHEGIEELNEKYNIQILNKNNFFEKYDESIWIIIQINQLKNCFIKKDYDVIKNRLEQTNELLEINWNISYIGKIADLLCPRTNIMKINVDEHNSLKMIFLEKYGNVKKLYNKTRLTHIEKLLIDREDVFKNICGFDDNEGKIFAFVNANTDELIRLVLLNYICIFLEIDVKSNFKISERSNLPLTYDSYRVVCFLMNRNFSFEKFKETFNYITSAKKQVTLDYSNLEIIEYLHKYLVFPKEVDDLIRVHEITNQLWKNGSKYLNFYTLHNQEHAIELIKSVSKIIKSIDFLQIKPRDYYILFIACYLHDISMVIHPDIDKVIRDDYFIDIQNEFINEMIKCTQNDFNNLELTLRSFDDFSLQKILLNTFKKIDGAIENEVRGNHAKDSAKKIKQLSELSFLDDLIKEHISEVSKAHGFDANEVYGRKSTAQDSYISEKYIKILLRMADLLDISENRVSSPLFNNNFNSMSDVSRYHWVSHSAISHFEISTDFENTVNDNDTEKSYLSLGAVKENVKISIYLNVKSFAPTSKTNCNLCYFEKGNFKKDGKLVIRINDSNKPIQCPNQYCNFICKWMVHKNFYLINELFELKKYLNNIPNNFFETDFSLEIVFNESAMKIANADPIFNKNFIESMI